MDTDKAIYYTKVEFRLAYRNDDVQSIILLNIPEQELVYQAYKTRTEKWLSTKFPTSDLRIISNQKTGFDKKLIKDKPTENEVVFSYGVKLSDEEMKSILPLCNALEYEPYRDQERSCDFTDGCLGYIDELSLYFRAVTDSYIPFIEIEMSEIYDDDHLWPNDRLYRYIVSTYLADVSKIPGWKPEYKHFWNHNKEYKKQRKKKKH